MADAGGEIAGGGLESGRSAGFEAEKAESEALKRGGELVDGGAAVAGALCTLFADPDAPAERGAGGNDDGLGAEKAVASGGEGEWFGVRGSWLVGGRAWKPASRTRSGWGMFHVEQAWFVVRGSWFVGICSIGRRVAEGLVVWGGAPVLCVLCVLCG